jgi:hypothetical protein
VIGSSGSEEFSVISANKEDSCASVNVVSPIVIVSKVDTIGAFCKLDTVVDKSDTEVDKLV